MTFSIRNIVGIYAHVRGDKRARKAFFGFHDYMLGDWGWFGNVLYTYLWGAHVAHGLEFLVAFFCYWLLYWDGHWLDEAREWRLGWVSRIVFFNLCTEVVIVSFWHYLTHVSSMTAHALKGAKFNPQSPYQPNGGRTGMFFSDTGNLEREITFTTLGWIQSAFLQCLFTHCWAIGFLSCYVDFWSRPLYTVTLMFLITYWREVHFYIAHRIMHPWFDQENGLLQGDIGAFLFRHAHSLHHKSYNPGPWSGLCMHPIEHFLYYSCATLPPLFLTVHPLHFLYTKFHADIAPVGGHDGHDDPAGNGNFHWLHHAKFEVNYGVPWPINLDWMLGTWAEYDDYVKTGVVVANGDWANKHMHSSEEDGLKEPLITVEDGSPSFANLSMAEVAQHNRRDDCWIVIYGQVLCVTDFMNVHPGGAQMLINKAGKDATVEFERIHASSGGYTRLIPRFAQNIRQVGTLTDYSGPLPQKDDSSRPTNRGYPGIALLAPVFMVFATLVSSQN